MLALRKECENFNKNKPHSKCLLGQIVENDLLSSSPYAICSADLSVCDLFICLQLTHDKQACLFFIFHGLYIWLVAIKAHKLAVEQYNQVLEKSCTQT